MATCRSTKRLVSRLTAAVYLCFIWYCQAGDCRSAVCRKSINAAVEQYILAEQYGEALCHLDNRFSCDKLDGSYRWTIHGLWPSGAVKGEPACCQPSSKLSLEGTGLLPRLDKKWPNLRKSSCRQCLWQHEWKKHGTCYPGATQYKYFNAALSMFENGLDFDKILKRANIEPSSDPYTVQEILSAFGGDEYVSEVICSRKSTNQNLRGCRGLFKQSRVVSHLKEIRICLGKTPHGAAASHTEQFKQTRCMFNGGPNYSTCGSGDAKQVYVMYQKY